MYHGTTDVNTTQRDRRPDPIIMHLALTRPDLIPGYLQYATRTEEKQARDTHLDAVRDDPPPRRHVNPRNPFLTDHQVPDAGLHCDEFGRFGPGCGITEPPQSSDVQELSTLMERNCTGDGPDGMDANTSVTCASLHSTAVCCASLGNGIRLDPGTLDLCASTLPTLVRGNTPLPASSVRLRIRCQVNEKYFSVIVPPIRFATGAVTSGFTRVQFYIPKGDLHLTTTAKFDERIWDTLKVFTHSRARRTPCSINWMADNGGPLTYLESYGNNGLVKIDKQALVIELSGPILDHLIANCMSTMTFLVFEV
ncbi:nonstructural protein 5 [Atlantic halibut reovirus]|nr:nonstructural protein 5 [Atlantic halibut reovirus]